MAGNNYFQFKQFRIIQEKSAMKVGTDGVLLGAWADISGASRILDVGTGTGLIALMLAQRSRAEISAVEIELNAFLEAKKNISCSPWKERITVYNTSFQEYARSAPGKFDLIVTNPPFFENAQLPADKSRSAARHASLLPFSELLVSAGAIISDRGKFSIILPATPAGRFMQLAANGGFWLQRVLEIKPNPHKSHHRLLMEFGTSPAIIQKSQLIIENTKHHDYTDEYKRLTRDFYIYF